MGKARRTNFMEFFSLAVVDNVKPNYLAVKTSLAAIQATQFPVVKCCGIKYSGGLNRVVLYFFVRSFPQRQHLLSLAGSSDPRKWHFGFSSRWVMRRTGGSLQRYKSVMFSLVPFHLFFFSTLFIFFSVLLSPASLSLHRFLLFDAIDPLRVASPQTLKNYVWNQPSVVRIRTYITFMEPYLKHQKVNNNDNNNKVDSAKQK